MSIPAINGVRETSTPKKVAAVAVPVVLVGAATVAAGLKGKGSIEGASGLKAFIKGIPVGYKAGFDKAIDGLTIAKDFVVKYATKAKDAVVNLFNKNKVEEVVDAAEEIVEKA